MTHLPFFKMQAAGNDFVLLDNRELKLDEKEIIELTPRLCGRRFGVGADGTLTLQPPKVPSLDYTMFYRNADGSDAGMCGNGARCLALFAEQAGLGSELQFSVHQNIYQAHVDRANSYVQIDFPIQLEAQQLKIPGEPILYQANTGTEHIVQIVSENLFEESEELKKRGRTLRYHSRFEPKGTNVNFVYTNQSNEIKLRTYERGVEDLTFACGTGAIASVIAWHWKNERHPGKNKMAIQTDGGILEVGFHYDTERDGYSDIELFGEAHFVFEGNFPL